MLLAMIGLMDGFIVEQSKKARMPFFRDSKRISKTVNFHEASCITVGLFDTDSGVKRCEHGAQSAECLQRAA